MDLDRNLQAEGLARVKHLKVLGKGENCSVLADAPSLQRLVADLVETVGMQLLGRPQVHEVATDIRKLGREPFEDEGGISVLACLSTSHVAIHTWPLRGEFHLDIYSCREFSAENVLNKLRGIVEQAPVPATEQAPVPATEAITERVPATGLGPSPGLDGRRRALRLEVHDLTFACDFQQAPLPHQAAVQPAPGLPHDAGRACCARSPGPALT